MVDGNSETDALRRWYLALPASLLLGGVIVGALAGGGLLHVATRLPNALVGLFGVVIATLCAWVATDYTAARWRAPGSERWKVLVVSAGVVGVLLVVVSELASWPFPAFVGLVALTIGVNPVVGEVRDDADDLAETRMLGGLVLSFGGTVVLAIPHLPGWTRLGAVVAILTGLGFFTGGQSAHTGQQATLRSRLLQVILGDAGRRGLMVAGIGVAVVGFGVGLLPVVLVGGWFVLVAMIVLSVWPEGFDLSPTMQWSVFGAGAGLVLFAGHQLFTTDAVGRSVWFVTFVVATIALAGVWIVWRGATPFLGVLIGFAFVWGLFSNTTNDPAGVSAEADGETWPPPVSSHSETRSSPVRARPGSMPAPTRRVPSAMSAGAHRRHTRRSCRSESTNHLGRPGLHHRRPAVLRLPADRAGRRRLCVPMGALLHRSEHGNEWRRDQRRDQQCGSRGLGLVAARGQILPDRSGLREHLRRVERCEDCAGDAQGGATRGHDLSRRLVACPRLESPAAKADSETSPMMGGFADGWARHRRSNHVVVTGGFAIESSSVSAREGRGVADSLAAGLR